MIAQVLTYTKIWFLIFFQVEVELFVPKTSAFALLKFHNFWDVYCINLNEN